MEEYLKRKKRIRALVACASYAVFLLVYYAVMAV